MCSSAGTPVDLGQRLVHQGVAQVGVEDREPHRRPGEERAQDHGVQVEPIDGGADAAVVPPAAFRDDPEQRIETVLCQAEPRGQGERRALEELFHGVDRDPEPFGELLEARVESGHDPLGGGTCGELALVRRVLELDRVDEQLPHVADRAIELVPALVIRFHRRPRPSIVAKPTQRSFGSEPGPRACRLRTVLVAGGSRRP
jgi:hypothetical protein